LVKQYIEIWSEVGPTGGPTVGTILETGLDSSRVVESRLVARWQYLDNPITTSSYRAWSTPD